MVVRDIFCIESEPFSNLFYEPFNDQASSSEDSIDEDINKTFEEKSSFDLIDSLVTDLEKKETPSEDH